MTLQNTHAPGAMNDPRFTMVRARDFTDPALARLVIFGRPAPQGSKKAAGTFKGKNGRTQVFMKESSPHVLPWRFAVEAGALEAMQYGRHPAFDGNLRMRMVFTMAKPKSAPKTIRTYPNTIPDLSKLIRSTEDALKTGGLFVDDARIVQYDRATKCYPNEDDDALALPGALIELRRMEGAP